MRNFLICLILIALLAPSAMAERWVRSKALTSKPHIYSRLLFGADQRVRVDDTSAPPFSFVTRIVFAFRDAYSTCTGVLIGPKHILTAGHCAFSRPEGGFAISAIASPGYQSGVAPFGSAHVTEIYIPQSWRRGDPNSDFALLTLDSDLGNLAGWVEIRALKTAIGKTISVVGYPGDLEQAEVQYATRGRVRAQIESRLVYKLDTAAGESGAALLFSDTINQASAPLMPAALSSSLGTRYFAIGVHSGGSASGNQGVRITPAILRVLQRLIR